jgi:hypothetical protein
MEAIAMMIKESLGGVVELRPYKCRKCRKYHLTSRIK